MITNLIIYGWIAVVFVFGYSFGRRLGRAVVSRRVRSSEGIAIFLLYLTCIIFLGGLVFGWARTLS